MPLSRDLLRKSFLSNCRNISEYATIAMSIRPIQADRPELPMGWVGSNVFQLFLGFLVHFRCFEFMNITGENICCYQGLAVLMASAVVVLKHESSNTYQSHIYESIDLKFG